MHCSLIMHGFHSGKWLILCSKTEQSTTSHILNVLEHSHIQNVTTSLFSDNSRLAQWKVTDTVV